MCSVIDMSDGKVSAPRVWEQPIDSGPSPENNATFDAIVVGGGPGGASAAGYLAKGGKRV